MKSAALPPGGGISLARKLVIGYAALAVFILAAFFFSAAGLYSLKSTARDIATSHLPAISALTEMRTSLLAQESYAGKYVIFKSNEFRELFRQKQGEYLAALTILQKNAASGETATLNRLSAEYSTAAERLFRGGVDDTVTLRATALTILDAVDALYTARQQSLQAKLEAANRQERSAMFWAFSLSFTGFLLAVAVAVVFTFRTFSAIRKLQQATHRIAAGDFDFDPGIPAGDEIGELAGDFTRMAARLKDLEQMSLDASPLTRLPGNIAIERVINKRLQEGARFALCYADLDNFKSYTDNYGYIKGSELIRLTGEIIYNAVKDCAESDAFVGHVGGDDFVMIVSAETAQAVCETVIERFDAEVVRHYTPADLARGGIEGADRYGVHRFFPVMTISIAVIINEAGEFASAVELARTAAEIKDYAKEKSGSTYLLSHRRKQPR